MWVVVDRSPYEASAIIFDTYEEAKDFFDRQEANGYSDIYLAEIKESK